MATVRRTTDATADEATTTGHRILPVDVQRLRPRDPVSPGMDRGGFPGSSAPADWPTDLDCAGKRIVIVGSGSTATLAPLAQTALTTMLQAHRPTIIAPTVHELVATRKPLDLPDEWVHEILRRQYIKQTDEIVTLPREQPRRLGVPSRRHTRRGTCGRRLRQALPTRLPPWQSVSSRSPTVLSSRRCRRKADRRDGHDHPPNEGAAESGRFAPTSSSPPGMTMTSFANVPSPSMANRWISPSASHGAA